ncbi:hypothetical protein MPTK1_7g15360 [Marchantia polymorpha subsp. ruderalis]|uniref:VWFA domain-containing protein n=2 Tax=Marchantia polymorpha TaxID=3197 RepID=A0A176VLB4_MARPO|nr:hypothetical protein AXG93_3873s1140 [Marchantia polymorpha subsp. ruderalis]PTQ47142.1 hypothetical protein MARPO_0009s0220 [Marchantia polymorpha]BBN17536.1 hypothetical protein Mp_7g15360 [Marchantia polymorpha subsp. ruderalis]|eukprot:PTQ47142.1 hypothetical protein MARPO_0009s0220 [Marchantia polymorpha]
MVRRWSVGDLRRSRVRIIVHVAVIFIVISQSSQAGGQPMQRIRGDEYLALIEDSVLQLAGRVAEMYPWPEQCDTDAPGACAACTQDECRPLTGPTQCVNVTKNARCNTHFPGCVASIAVSKDESRVAFPRESIEERPDKAQLKSICGTKGLDGVFKDLYAKNPYHASYYVGFIDGTRRLYPGRDEADENSLYSCAAYDPRKRPWYNAAITHRNHLIILIDTRYVPLDASFTQKTDTLSLYKDFAQELLQAVYDGDRVNVVAFDSKARALVPSSVVVEINVEHPQHHDELEVLDSKMAELTRPDQGGDKLASSNLGSGLQEALRLFGEADDTMAKNIIVFTNGGILSDEALNTTLDAVASNSVRLFLYSTKSTDANHQLLNQVANRSRGIHIRLTSSQNRLWSLRSYFSYLAALQQTAGRIMPFWTPSYTDYYDIGEITTVTVPILSPVGQPVGSSEKADTPQRLIGVAGIDVLYLEIGDILDEFRAALQNRQVEDGVYDDHVFNSTMPYDDSSVDSCNEISDGPDVLCKSDSNVKTKFLDRMCCRTCSEGSGRSNSKFWIYMGSSLGGLFVMAVLISILIIFLRIRRGPVAAVEPEPPKAPDPPPKHSNPHHTLTKLIADRLPERSKPVSIVVPTIVQVAT